MNEVTLDDVKWKDENEKKSTVDFDCGNLILFFGIIFAFFFENATCSLKKFKNFFYSLEQERAETSRRKSQSILFDCLVFFQTLLEMLNVEWIEEIEEFFSFSTDQHRN